MPAAQSGVLKDHRHFAVRFVCVLSARTSSEADDSAEKSPETGGTAESLEWRRRGVSPRNSLGDFIGERSGVVESVVGALEFLYSVKMMKRSGTNGVVQDSPVLLKEHYVPVSKSAEPTKVVWHVDPVALVGPREEEARRKAPEAKYLYGISTVLTIVLLWGVFRHMHYVFPQVFSSSSVVAQENSLVSLGEVESNVNGFHAVDTDSAIGGRTVRHLLEMVHPQQSLPEERQPVQLVFRDQSQHRGQPYYTRRGGNFRLRPGGST